MTVWTPLTFNCGKETSNRFVIAPLTTDASHEDGTAPDNELEFVRRRSASEFGATISSAAYVAEDGRSWQGIGAAHDGHLVQPPPACGRDALGGRACDPPDLRRRPYLEARVDRRRRHACAIRGRLVASGRQDAEGDDVGRSREPDCELWESRSPRPASRLRRRRGSRRQPLRGSSILLAPGQSSR